MTTSTKPRPVYRNINVLDLMHYRLPMPGVISILHRISGALLFLLIPAFLGLLQMSLKSEAGFETFKAMIWGNVFAKIFLLGMLYFFVHHFCAGIRYLLLDLHKGVDLKLARRSSYIVVVVSVLISALLAVKLW
jgi:succinate dehydrogenase / fumarate reductase, cytochrome b subunit